MYNFAQRYEGVTGSAIRNIFALLADPSVISFAGGNPSPRTFPGEVMSQIAARLLLEKGDSLLQYGGTLGIEDLREDIVSLMRKEGIAADMQNVIVLTGSSQGIELLTKAMVNSGDTVLVESPTFLGALQTFKLYEANVVGVDMDEQGMDLCDLEAKIKLHSPKFVYTIPTFQNPSGITMPEQRRKAMVEICKKYGTLILEDDPYAALRYSGQPQKSIKCFDDADIVIRLISFSKTISPGLRVGGAVAHPDIINKYNLGKQGQDTHTPNLNQAMVSQFIREGHFERHIQSNCALYSEKLNKMLGAIDAYFPKDIKILKPQGGMFIWAELPSGMDALALFKTAVENKVAYVPGTHFYADGGHLNTLRFNFTMASDEQIEQGMQTLGKILR